MKLRFWASCAKLEGKNGSGSRFVVTSKQVHEHAHSLQTQLARNTNNNFEIMSLKDNPTPNTLPIQIKVYHILIFFPKSEVHSITYSREIIYERREKSELGGRHFEFPQGNSSCLMTSLRGLHDRTPVNVIVDQVASSCLFRCFFLLILGSKLNRY